MNSSRLAIALSGILLSLSASAQRLSPGSVTASSSYPPEGMARYDAKQVVDAKLATSWVEGDEGGGLGSWIAIDLGGDKVITEVKMWAGMWYSYDYWQRANRPSSIEFKFADGTTELHELTDKMVMQSIKLNKPHTTSSLRIKVKGIYRGTTWNDTAISEVQVIDNTDDGAAKIRSYASSSELPEDDDGNYKPVNVEDGIGDSMWCEGVEDGDGTGEWLQFNFDGSQDVSKIEMVNGIGSSMSVWMKGNRATKATLEFSDGSTTDISIKPTFLKQTITFPARSATSVKMTFTAVMKGSKFNDLCVSEARFR